MIEEKIFSIAASAAGIGGLAIAFCLIIFRELIGKKIFPQLTKKQAYQVINRIIMATTIISLAGIGAWLLNLYMGNPSTVEKAQPKISFNCFVTQHQDKNESGKILDFQVVNNSDQTLLIHKVTFDNIKTKIDTTPEIKLDEYSNASLSFTNMGWGPAMDLNLTLILKNDNLIIKQYEYAISRIDETAQITIGKDIETSWIERSWQNFISDIIYIDYRGQENTPIYHLSIEALNHSKSPHKSFLVNVLKQHGIQINIIDATPQNNPPQYFDLEKWEIFKKQLFGRSVPDTIEVCGVLKYSGKDGYGKKITDDLKFSFIETIVSEPLLSMTAMLPSHFYDVLFDVTTNVKDQISVLVSHQIHEKDADRFQMNLIAPKSSHQSYSLTIHTNLGNQTIGNFNTYIYMPKNSFHFYKRDVKAILFEKYESMRLENIGQPITLNIKNIEHHNVVELIHGIQQDQDHLIFKGIWEFHLKSDINYNQVPWGKILSDLARQNNLEWSIKENAIWFKIPES